MTLVKQGLLSLMLIGCVASGISAANVSRGVSVVMPLSKGTVHGVVRFEELKEGVRMFGQLAGFTPNSTHGFHVHECGDCTGLEGASAGGHYNPTQMVHGGPEMDHHHRGDLGNLEADGNGVASFNVTIKGLYLNGPQSIIGRGVIIHEKADDLTTQPSGGSGARIGCGVIGISQ